MSAKSSHDPQVTWSGRIDSTTDETCFRVHQCVRPFKESNTASKTEKKVVFVGFCCDEGVRRNQGRTGAALAPHAIREALGSLAYPSHMPSLFDFGNISCASGSLEEAQELLAATVAKVAQANALSFVLGGGHETSWGHFLGLERAHPGKRIGILNLDAHFDLRPLDQGPSSGTPFLQIAEHLKTQNKEFSYLCLGIQEASNTKALFNTATELGVEWMSAEEMRLSGPSQVQDVVEEFQHSVDALYLTVCLDAFGHAWAPGVSAPTPFGLNPEWLEILLRPLAQKGKLVGADIVELNPKYDQDQQTAKLAAHSVYKILRSL